VAAGGGAGLGPVVPIEVDSHAAVGGGPEDAVRPHGGAEVAGGEDGVDGADDSAHDQLHAGPIGAQTQSLGSPEVQVVKEPLFLFRNQENPHHTRSRGFYTTRGVAPWWSGERMPLQHMKHRLLYNQSSPKVTL